MFPGPHSPSFKDIPSRAQYMLSMAQNDVLPGLQHRVLIHKGCYSPQIFSYYIYIFLVGPHKCFLQPEMKCYPVCITEYWSQKIKLLPEDSPIMGLDVSPAS